MMVDPRAGKQYETIVEYFKVQSTTNDCLKESDLYIKRRRTVEVQDDR